MRLNQCCSVCSPERTGVSAAADWVKSAGDSGRYSRSQPALPRKEPT